MTAIVRTSATSSRMEPIVQVSKTQLGLSYFRGFGDTTIWKKPWMRMATPNDVSSNVNGLALRTRRNATASIAIEDECRHDDAGRRQEPPGHSSERQRVHHVGADGDELAVSEVEEVEDTEHDGQAEREQRVGAPPPQPVDHLLDELGHGVATSGRALTRPRGRPRTGPSGYEGRPRHLPPRSFRSASHRRGRPPPTPWPRSAPRSGWCVRRRGAPR